MNIPGSHGDWKGEFTPITPIAQSLAVDLSLPALTTWVCRGWNSNTQSSAYSANALTDYATAEAAAIEQSI